MAKKGKKKGKKGGKGKKSAKGKQGYDMHVFDVLIGNEMVFCMWYFVVILVKIYTVC